LRTNPSIGLPFAGWNWVYYLGKLKWFSTGKPFTCSFWYL